MTFLDIEKLLEDRGFRLTRAVRLGRRYHVAARDVDTNVGIEASGIDLEDAVRNLIALVEKRPRRVVRRYAS